MCSMWSGVCDQDNDMRPHYEYGTYVYLVVLYLLYVDLQRLHATFGDESLEAFGLLRSHHAIRAAGGLLG